MNAVKMTDGNLALDRAREDAPVFTVITGGRGRLEPSPQPAPSVPLASFRALGFAVAACVLVFSILPSVFGRIQFEHALMGTATQQIVVDSGDSLWSLAESHPVSGMSTEDTVRLMKSWNELEHAVLAPGQTLFVAAE